MKERAFSRLKYEDCLKLHSLLALLPFENTFINKKKTEWNNSSDCVRAMFFHVETCASRHQRYSDTPTVCVSIPEHFSYTE
jgi:hypothetical protein